MHEPVNCQVGEVFEHPGLELVRAWALTILELLNTIFDKVSSDERVLRVSKLTQSLILEPNLTTIVRRDWLTIRKRVIHDNAKRLFGCDSVFAIWSAHDPDIMSRLLFNHTAKFSHVSKVRKLSGELLIARSCRTPKIAGVLALGFMESIPIRRITSFDRFATELLDFFLLITKFRGIPKLHDWVARFDRNHCRKFVISISDHFSPLIREVIQLVSVHGTRNFQRTHLLTKTFLKGFPVHITL